MRERVRLNQGGWEGGPGRSLEGPWARSESRSLRSTFPLRVFFFFLSDSLTLSDSALSYASLLQCFSKAPTYGHSVYNCHNIVSSSTSPNVSTCIPATGASDVVWHEASQPFLAVGQVQGRLCYLRLVEIIINICLDTREGEWNRQYACLLYRPLLKARL